MNIQHQIVSFHAPTGSMVVRYFCDEFPNGLTFNIDVPIQDGAYPSQQEISELIAHFRPVGQLERAVAIQSIQVPTHLSELPTAPQLDDATLAQQVRAQRNSLLGLSDWTQLSDVQLGNQEKQAWTEYRQLLRDVTAQAGFPTNIIWPLSPIDEPR